MGIVPIAGVVGAPVLSLMNKISGNMSTQKKQTTGVVTDTKVVAEIGAKITIDVNTQKGVEVAIDVVVGIETEKEGLVVGTHKTEVEAQDETAVVIGKVIVEYIHRIVMVQEVINITFFFPFFFFFFWNIMILDLYDYGRTAQNYFFFFFYNCNLL